MKFKKRGFFPVFLLSRNLNKQNIDKAERIIELAANPRKRAAMRYYYICAVKSYEEVAELCCCSVSSVQRWILKKK